MQLASVFILAEEFFVEIVHKTISVSDTPPCYNSECVQWVEVILYNDCRIIFLLWHCYVT